MQLGFVSAILPDLGLEEVLQFAADSGFDCVELMCWPKGRAERRYAGAHFENPVYNQNRKIATGGTFVALSSPGASLTAEKDATSLRLACTLPSAARWIPTASGVPRPSARYVTSPPGARTSAGGWPALA